MAPALVSRDELAALLGVHPRTILRAEKRGDIPSYRVGRLRKYDAAEVFAALHSAPYMHRPGEPAPSPEPRGRGRAAKPAPATVAALRAGGGDAA